MSTVAIPLFDPSISSSVAISNEAVAIVREREREYEPARQAPASFAWRGSLLEQIAEVVDECSVPAWDGYDAEPVSLFSAGSASDLVRNLPAGIQMPAIVPEPDGAIALEWQTDDSRLFSLSVNGPAVTYAGRFGGSSRQYGEERFFGTLPRTILEILTRYFSLE